MPERESVLQVLQIAPETTPGTPVAATKKFVAEDWPFSPRLNINNFRPMGYKFRTFSSVGKEWVEGSIRGEANYEELQYPLCSVLKDVVGTGAGADKTWTFTPASAARDTLRTFTVEQGNDVQAERAAGVFVTDFGITFTRDSVSVDGRVIGRRVTTGHTLTGGTTEVGTKPVLPKDVSVFLDTTAGGIGTTKLLRVLEARWGVQNRQGMLWVLDAAQTSFVTSVEIEPTVEVRLKLEADAVGMGFIAAPIRTGDTRWVRIVATGDTLGGGTYKLQFDTALKCKNVGELADQDGVYAMEYTFDVVHDAGWAKAMTATLVNSVAAL